MVGHRRKDDREKLVRDWLMGIFACSAVLTLGVCLYLIFQALVYQYPP